MSYLNSPGKGCPRGMTIGPSVDDQAVSLSDDGTTIIIDFFSFLFFFSLLSTAVVKIPEGVVVGFQIFAWALSDSFSDQLSCQIREF